MSWFNNLSPTVQAALIGAVVTLFGILVKDLTIALWQERKKSEKDLLAIFQKYADPLSSAATSMLWRLNEIFSKEGRGAYLKGDAPPNTYNAYKKISTLYRLASLIGWIRAFRRELSYLRVRDKEGFQSMQKALDEFESALADGPQMELERLDLLAKLWLLELPTDKLEKAALAVELEHAVHRQFHNESIDGTGVISLEVKQKVCSAVADALCSRLKIKSLSQDVVNETKAKACDIFTIKETWFYRDWQAALGDIMIKEVSGSARRFDVVGFGEFESFWLSGDDTKKIWLSRLNEILDDLDVFIADDCRVKQLQKIFEATAQLVKALASISASREIISKATLDAAERVLAKSHADGEFVF